MILNARIATPLCGLLLATSSHANIVQYFWGNTYLNPAQLGFTKDLSLAVGAIPVNVKESFTGIAASGEFGVSRSDENSVPVYFTGSKRINSNWVVGLNVSPPIYSNLGFPVDATTRFETTETIVRNVDINPQVSYKVNDKWMVGVGFNANDTTDFQVNFTQPGFGNTVNKSPGWGYGFNAGLMYFINQTNILGLTFYSKINSHLNGTSSAGGLINSNYQLKNFEYPNTIIANYIRYLKKNWVISNTFYWSQWNRTEGILLLNVVNAGNLDFPVHYRNTVAFKFETKYDLNDKFSLLGGFLVDQGGYTRRGPYSTLARTISFSSASFPAVFGGASTLIAKNTTLQGVVGYGGYNTNIDHPFGFPTTGGVKVRLFLADVRLTYAF